MRIAKRQIVQLLNRIVVANVTLMRFAQVACFVTSVIVLTLGIWNLIHCELTAVQTVLGILLSSLTSLVFIGIGLLLPNAIATDGEESE